MQCILIPLDGSALAEAVIPTALELARDLDAHIVLVNVVTPTPAAWGAASPGWGPVGTWDVPMTPLTEQTRAAEEYLASVKQQTGLPEDRVRTDAHVGTLPRGILEAVHKHGADLIAMSTHGRGGLGRLVMGSVTDMVIRLAEVPVLVVRPPVTG
ncbi:MAG: universal stress protein [Clostridia bacterium]